MAIPNTPVLTCLLLAREQGAEIQVWYLDFSVVVLTKSQLFEPFKSWGIRRNQSSAEARFCHEEFEVQ